LPPWRGVGCGCVGSPGLSGVGSHFGLARAGCDMLLEGVRGWMALSPLVLVGACSSGVGWLGVLGVCGWAIRVLGLW
jgi:hypothetical protein